MIVIHNNKIEQQCGLCGKQSHMELTPSEIETLKRYLAGGLLIQDCFPDLNRCEREFLKSGYCPKCQELLFGNGKTKRIRQ